MIIQYNNAAANAYRHLNNLNKSLSTHSAKLSSGYKINSAADDAAGLAISEKMRSQIRGLLQAERNVGDGISLIQTAEGALGEIHDMLQRMRELAVQSSNDTYDSKDRQKIEGELIALRNEIDSLSKRTTYNEIILLDGSQGNTGSSSSYTINDVGETLFMVPATQTGGTGVQVNWGNIGGQDLNWLRDDLANNIVPMIVEDILDTFSYLDFFSGSTITVNLLTESSSGGRASFQTGGGQTYITFNLYLGTNLLTTSANSSGYISDEARDRFHSVVAHEMMHLVMFASTSNITSSGPLWFKEGMAQTISGAIDYALDGTESDTQIRNLLGNLNANEYAGGYYASMYLGYLIAGGGAVTNENIAQGLNILLGELATGRSLDSIINSYTNYTNTNNYQAQLRNDAGVVDFVRELIAATGDGAGSVLAPFDQKSVISSNGNFTYTGNETFLKIDASTGSVRNYYPAYYMMLNGGNMSSSGSPIHPSYDPDIDPPDPPVDPPVEPPDPPVNPPGPNPSGGLYIQTGANAGQGLYIYIEGASSQLLGIENSSVLTVAQSQLTIGDMDNAIGKVSQIRTELGVVQNKLEHTMKNLGIYAENLSFAESKIRDTDMAKQMMQFVKTNIGMQATQMMLAQANQHPQMMLSLLK